MPGVVVARTLAIDRLLSLQPALTIRISKDRPRLDRCDATLRIRWPIVSSWSPTAMTTEISGSLCTRCDKRGPRGGCFDSRRRAATHSQQFQDVRGKPRRPTAKRTTRGDVNVRIGLHACDDWLYSVCEPRDIASDQHRNPDRASLRRCDGGALAAAVGEPDRRLDEDVGGAQPARHVGARNEAGEAQRGRRARLASPPRRARSGPSPRITTSSGTPGRPVPRPGRGHRRAAGDRGP